MLEVTWRFIFLKITYSEVPYQALAEICLMNRKKKRGKIIEGISTKRHFKSAVLCQTRIILKVPFA